MKEIRFKRTNNGMILLGNNVMSKNEDGTWSFAKEEEYIQSSLGFIPIIAVVGFFIYIGVEIGQYIMK